MRTSEAGAARPGTADIILLSPHRKWSAWSEPPGPEESDGQILFRILTERGYPYRRLDPGRFPFNPFGRSAPALTALDPWRALTVLLCHRRARIVLCFFESAALLPLLLRRVFRFRAKIVVWDLGVGGDWRLRDLILRLAVPRADALLPLNSVQVPELRALADPRALVVPVRKPVNPDFFRPAGDRPDGYILAIGDDRSRDYDTLLAAVAGLDRDVVLRTALVDGDRAAHPRLRVLREPLSLTQYRDLIAGALLVVLPLRPVRSPGGVTALVEAMSCGKPVVVSDSPGLADYLRDGGNCLLVPAGDAGALRRAIDALTEDAGLRQRIGAEARRSMEQHCSPQAVARALEDVFRRLLGEPKQP